LASGLLVVCTDRTGGPDLARLGLSRLIRVVPSENPAALREALGQSLREASTCPTITAQERAKLDWKRYADRDLTFMQEVLDKKVKKPA
jgi:glycosyltransferase involved in cell wall biosynthesis